MKLQEARDNRPIYRECDIASVETILDFYDRPYSDTSLRSFLHQHPYGSLTTEIADCLFQHGVTPTIMTANPHIFSPDAWREFGERSERWGKSENFTVNEFERVIKKGVHVINKVPSLDEIKQELDAKHPVLICFTSTPQLNSDDFYFHYAVIVDHRNEDFIVLDSFPQRTATSLPDLIIHHELTTIEEKNPNLGLVIFTKPREGFESKFPNENA